MTERELVSAAVVHNRSERGGFEFDGGLGLVSGPVADAGEGGDRVEQPAHAGGGNAMKVPLQLP